MHDYIQPLQDLASRWNVSDAPFTNARRLAEGDLNIVIMLREPCDLAEEADYDTMVWGDASARRGTAKRMGSPTLQEVDYCIRFATGERYGIEDVSVFDMSTLLSKKRQRASRTPDQDERDAHDVFWKMVVRKKPDVILVLQCEAGLSAHNQVRRLRSSQMQAGTMGVVWVEGVDALVVRGFHPSSYLRQDYNKGATDEERNLRIDMIDFCFATAFNALAGFRTHTNSAWTTAWTNYCSRLGGRTAKSSDASSSRSQQEEMDRRRRIDQKLGQLSRSLRGVPNVEDDLAARFGGMSIQT
ncbi:MAG: hypothetical protein M1816_003195 [Peltula sp. TS41687]|nr:MAG: hypothetical protein M1816_003195 [Peltula sp. TS41687]